MPPPVEGESARQAARVTVIVPAYNYGHYLPRAIESILEQTVTDFEILIVDDGSTDDTATIADAYAKNDARVRCIHQENAGLSAARNNGLQAARTPWVTFLDADDELSPHFLERCLATLEGLPSNFAMVACNSRRIDSENRLLPEKFRDFRGNREISRQDLILKNRFPANVLVRRDVFDRAGEFDPSLTSSEDRDMWIRIARTQRIFYLAEPLVSIRSHPSNMSRNSDRMRRNMRKVLHKALREEKFSILKMVFRLKVASYFHFQNAWMRHQEGRQACAIADMLISLLLWPFFVQPRTLNEPSLFRLRGLGRFALHPGKRNEP